MRSLCFIFIVLVALLFTQNSWAGPWLPKAKDGQLISATIATYSNDGFESIPDPSGLPRFTLCTHFEYGITDDVTLVMDADFQRFSPSDLNFGTAGYRLDKAMAGARVPLAQWGHTVVSIEAMFGTDAVYDNTARSILASTRGAEEGRLMIGNSFTIFGLNSFVALEAGGRLRSGPPADEATLDATLGLAPSPRSLLLLQSFSMVSIDAARAPYQRYLLSKAQFSAAYRVFGSTWLQAGGFATAAHANTGAEHGGIVSVWWKF